MLKHRHNANNRGASPSDVTASLPGYEVPHLTKLKPLARLALGHDERGWVLEAAIAHHERGQLDHALFLETERVDDQLESAAP